MAKRILPRAGFLVLAAMSLYATVHVGPAGARSITIDASRPIDIERPFEIAEIGLRGERGLYVPPTAGQGWRGTGGGSATYRFDAPATGEYHVWAYCFWRDACSNAIYARFDGNDRAIIGNDPVYTQWHWVRAFAVPLSEGSHALELANHSPTVAVQTLFLTTSTTAQPETHALVFDDLFYEGFDGCDAGVLDKWAIHSGKWTVRDSDAGPPGSGELVARSASEACITRKVETGESCVIAVRSWLPSNGRSASAAGMSFTAARTRERFLLEWRRTSRPDELTVLLAKLSETGRKALESFPAACAESDWHSISVEIRKNRIDLAVDGGRKRRIPLRAAPIDEIGLWASGNAEARFDDIQVKSLLEPQGRRSAP